MDHDTYEHGIRHGSYDAQNGEMHARNYNEDTFDGMPSAYRRGYEAGWTDGQPDIDTSRIES